MEAMTYRFAHQVISVNESYKQVALTRGRRDPSTVTVVRSGPDTAVMRPIVVPDAKALRAGRDYLAVYLGIMGQQDGVDLALRAFAELVHTHGRTDCHFALLGFGDCLNDLKALSAELGLTDQVTFTGRVGAAEIAQYLSAAHVGICPDPKTSFNDVSTMNKTMEYMAYCVPIVSFDLAETRVSADGSAVYVESGDIAGFARAWTGLLNDPDDRVRRGVLARERVSRELDWRPQERRYVKVWVELLGLGLDRVAFRSVAETAAAGNANNGRWFVDVGDKKELEYFVRHRTLPDVSAQSWVAR
jgi:glycosyltransferase involved in cell wall biosynthesis